jgi:membrane protein implicated in regulation of membrane protease activity
MENTQLVWLIVGLTLIAVELFTGTLALLFMGIGALALAGLNKAYPAPLWLELLIFAVIAWGSFYFFWKKKSASGGTYENDRDQSLQLSTGLAGHAQDYINYQGSQWLATNESGEPLAAGETVRIVRTEGNRLIITKK